MGNTAYREPTGSAGTQMLTNMASNADNMASNLGMSNIRVRNSLEMDQRSGDGSTNLLNTMGEITRAAPNLTGGELSFLGKPQMQGGGIGMFGLSSWQILAIIIAILIIIATYMALKKSFSKKRQRSQEETERSISQPAKTERLKPSVEFETTLGSIPKLDAKLNAVPKRIASKEPEFMNNANEVIPSSLRLTPENAFSSWAVDMLKANGMSIQLKMA